MTTAQLDPRRVQEIFQACLRAGTEKVEGIHGPVYFNPDVLDELAAEILTLLKELPDGFMQSKGGGATFLSACHDRHGNLWTGEQAVMAQLFLLGMGIGKVTLPFERSLWPSLPGGMPYYCVNDVE